MDSTSRPNFFILLGLSPDEQWDQSAFEKVLREKRIEWSRQSAGIAKKALLAKQNLALIPIIYSIMADAASREKEAVQARSARSAALAHEYAYFERQLAFMNAKAVVDQAEVARFVDAYKHLLPADEIAKRIQVKIGSPDTPQRFDRPVLDASLFKNIHDRLQFLHLHTLYELLQRSKMTATPELRRAAEQLYTRTVSLPATAENTAKSELAGLAQDIFKSNEARGCYDESVRLQAFDNLLKDLDDVMSRATSKEVSQKQVLLFLEQVRQAGWKEEDALERLAEHARLHKWNVATSVISSQVQKLLCPACDHLNDPEQHYCTTCNQPLYVNCPQCGTSVACECIACGTCGFNVGNRYLVDSLLKELPGLLNDGDVQAADELICEAIVAWPSRVHDVRAQQIEAYRAAMFQMFQVQQQARKDVLELLAHLKISEISTNEQRWLCISWSPPALGKVIILKSMEPLHLEGTTLKVARLAEIGQVLQSRGNAAADIWRPLEQIYYTPAIVLVQDAYLGSSQPYACIENVKELRCQPLGAVLRLRWIWPEVCNEVSISYSTKPHSQPGDPTATTFAVKRADYDRLHYFDVHNLTKSECSLVVAAIMEQEGKRLVAQGTQIHVQLSDTSVITYEIRRSLIGPKRRTLHLALDLHKPLPVLLLVSKQGGIPLYKTDGELFYRLKVALRTTNDVVIDLPSIALPPGTFGKLFLEDDTLYHEFTVHHPHQDQMRLS